MRTWDLLVFFSFIAIKQCLRPLGFCATHRMKNFRYFDSGKWRVGQCWAQFFFYPRPLFPTKLFQNLIRRKQLFSPTQKCFLLLLLLFFNPQKMAETKRRVFPDFLDDKRPDWLKRNPRTGLSRKQLLRKNMKLKKCNKREKIEGGTLNLVRKFSHLGFIGTKKISRWHRTLGLTMISFKLNWPSTCQMAVLVTPPVKNWTSYPKTRVQIPSKNKKITSSECKRFRCHDQRNLLRLFQDRLFLP